MIDQFLLLKIIICFLTLPLGKLYHLIYNYSIERYGLPSKVTWKLGRICNN